MPNANDINNNYSPAHSYSVQSSAFVRVEFGSINLPSFPVINAVLVEFHNGGSYLYIGVPVTLYHRLQLAVREHIVTDGQTRLGSLFSRELFNSFPTYARLHGG